MYRLEFTAEAKSSIARFKKSSPSAYKKIAKLLDELMEHPRTGLGRPEPLSGGESICYSRRIDKKNRLVYDIYDEIVSVLIITAEGHYHDKPLSMPEKCG